MSTIHHGRNARRTCHEYDAVWPGMPATPTYTLSGISRFGSTRNAAGSLATKYSWNSSRTHASAEGGAGGVAGTH
jgi:hypothetical protein